MQEVDPARNHKSENRVKLKIDGKDILVEPNTTIFEAARKLNINIPHLCYHERLPISGACRLCLVEVKGAKTLVASCAMPVQDGMEVWTNTDRVIQARRLVLDLLLSDHPEDCRTCEKCGDCKLQDYAYEYGVREIKFAGEKRKFPLEDGNPFIIRDYNKCILCGRCVRMCDDIMGISAIDFSHRGFKTKVSCAFNVDLTESPCVLCGNCVNVCPVGALQEKTTSLYRTWELKKVTTICPYCGCGCVLELHVKDNRIIKVTSPLDSPTNSGNLCIKGKFGYEFVHSPERLKRPLVREASSLKSQTSGKNSFKEASWEDALNIVANKLQDIKERYGPDAIGGFASAKCTNEENYLFQKFIRAVIGTNNVDHCARLCHAPTVAGLARALGSGAMTNTISDITEAEVILVIGSNTTEAHPIIGLKIKEAIRKRGAKLIVIDPREIPLVEFASLHLRQKPGTDVAVINGMINHIIKEGLEDKEFINLRCEGFEELKDAVDEWTPEKAEEISDVPAEQIRRAAEIYAQAKNASIIWSMGITQHTTGTDNVLSLTNLALLCGNFGRAGCGVNPLRGQNNVQGACDMGALPNVFPGYQAVDCENIREKFEKKWGRKLSPKVGLTLTEMIPAIEEGRIKALYIMGENPMVSDPDINHVRSALQKLDFLVVQDIFLSETAQFADVVLPAVSFAEKEGTFTNTERRVQRLNKAITPPGEAKPDWEIICALSKRLGYEMDYQSPKDIMDEIAEVTPIYGGIVYDRLGNEGLHWPCPDKEHPGTKILHKDRFTRGKGLFHPIKYLPPKEEVDHHYPFILTTGRLLPQFHTGTMTRRVEGIERIAGECLIEINKEDAKRLNLSDEEKVKVISRRGEISAKIKVRVGIKPGVIFIPFHFAEAAANALTNPALDPVSKIPEYKVCAVRIEKIKKR